MECAQAYNAFCCLAEYNVAESEFLHGPNKTRVPLANSLSGQLATAHLPVEHEADEEGGDYYDCYQQTHVHEDEHAADQDNVHFVVDELRLIISILRPVHFTLYADVYFAAATILRLLLQLIIDQIVTFFVYLEALKVHVNYSDIDQQCEHDEHSYFDPIFQLGRTDSNSKYLENHDDCVEQCYFGQCLAHPGSLVQ